MINWISVNEELPENGKLVLVKCVVWDEETDPLRPKKREWIFQGRFTRSKGWYIYYHPHDFKEVLYWSKESTEG